MSRAEGRVLISLDKDFTNTVRYRPPRYSGIIVLRLSEPLYPQDIDDALRRVLGLAQTRSPGGRLWIVDDHRIREFAEDEED